MTRLGARARGTDDDGDNAAKAKAAVAALTALGAGGDDILGQPLASGFNLQDTMATVARHYLERGMQEAGNNKTKAAELLGLSSYQTLTNWLEKYEVQP